MALTFTISGLDKSVMGNKRVHSGTITLSGTNSDDGDAITAAQLALGFLEDLQLATFLDSTSNPENALIGTWNKNSGKIVFHTAHGTPGGTIPLLQVTDGTTLTNYFARFEATGR
jgi:hypothetical protein